MHLDRKHALPTRIFHWTNAPILAVMIWSGLLIYWAHGVYELRLGRIALVKFFPEWFYRDFNLSHRLAEGMAWHFTFMWLFGLNGMLYVIYTAWSGEWRDLLPNRHTIGEAWQVVRHDLGISKEPLPRRKFNGAQRLAYTGIVAMGVGSVLTGLAIYKPVQLAWLTTALGGYALARAEHFGLTVGYVAFFVIHIAQVMRGLEQLPGDGDRRRAGARGGMTMSTSGDDTACPTPLAAATPPPVDGTPANRLPRPNLENPARRLRSLSRRGFALAGLAVLGGLGGWRWLNTQRDEDEIPWPLRRVLRFNERLARAAFSDARLSPSFARSAGRVPRVNGSLGINSVVDPSTWRLRVFGAGEVESPRFFSLDEIRSLPRVEMTTELRCIEGWSTVVHWAGARFADLVSLSGLATRGGVKAKAGQSAEDLCEYVALETPDREYYVGLDMASALHPQTLLCYEMAGAPLTPGHGAPLRLVTPVKYGIKSIKRIGTIRFTDDRPADYWAERGYDWYAGH